MKRPSPTLSPEERLAAFVEACGGAVRKSGKEIVFRCPCHANHAHGDRNPSGNVRVGDDGHLLVICRIGCATADIVSAIGWTLADLMPPTSTRRPQTSRPNTRRTSKRYSSALEVADALARSRQGELVEFYIYRQSGRDHGLVARVLRADGKKELPQARCEDGQWVPAGMKKPIPLFNLEAMLAADRRVPVQLHEGESKALLATKLGFVALSCAMGAGNAKYSDLSPLAGLVVHVFGDNDAVGSRHVEDVAERAHAAGAAMVWRVTLPDLPVGGDIIDFYNERRAAGVSDQQIADEVRDAIAKSVEIAPAARTTRSTAVPLDNEMTEDHSDRVSFPVESLPSALRAIVTEGAKAYEVDSGFFGVPLLAIGAGAIGASRHVVVRPTWREPSILWAATVAISGFGKSPPLDVLLVPLRQYDEELLRKTEEAYQRYREEHAAWTRAQRRKDADDAPAPEPPPILSMLLDDITLETIAPRAVANPRLLMALDEMATWLGGFDRYRGGRGADEAHWLRFYGGRPTKVERRHALPIYVPRPHISICGGVQPRVLARLLDRSKRESGLAARILLAAPPTRPPTWTTATIAGSTESAYHSVVRSLLALMQYEPPRGLPLTADAVALFREAATRLGIDGFELATGGDEDLGAAYQKLRSAVPRIALVLALAQAAETGQAEHLRDISAEAMAGAIKIGDYFAAHTRIVYARWRADEGDPFVTRILGVVRASGPAGATRTQIRDALGRNARADLINAALEALSGQGLIERVPHDPVIGRPPERWRTV